MKCPVDQSNLQVSHSDDRIGWKCKSCDGIWLPANVADVITFFPWV